MSYDERPRVCEQLRQLQDPVDRLWWLAQLERGIEVADIDREPRFGSRAVLSHLAEVYDPPTEKKAFDAEWEAAKIVGAETEIEMPDFEVTR